MAIPLPAAVLAGGALLFVVRSPVDFTGPDGRQHPAAAWTCWSPESFALECQGWSAVPIADPRPADTATTRYRQRPEAEWEIGSDALTVTYTESPVPLEERRAAVVEAVNVARNHRLAIGAPFQAKLIDVSDKGRADLGGMAIAAMLAQAGSTPWTEGYSAGWITMDNSRLPLPAPADGIALSAAVGDWYGRTMQHARTLKDAVLQSSVPETVDISTGWPE